MTSRLAPAPAMLGGVWTGTTTSRNLPAAVREKIGVYNGRKAALKNELHEVIVQNDQTSPAKRLKAIEELADRQWPQLAITFSE